MSINSARRAARWEKGKLYNKMSYSSGGNLFGRAHTQVWAGQANGL